MARKYGKNATTKNNVFKLVEALLALADGEIDVPGDKLKATFNVEWVKEDELLVSGKFQQKRNKQTKIVEGITKEDLWALVECFGKALELSQPKDEKNVDNAQRRGEAIQDVLDCLKDLGILDLKPSARNQGFWKFSLKLNHQTAEKKDNLEVIEEKWKVKIGSVTVEISHETPKPKEEPINWQEICRHNLAQQKQLTTNLFTNANGMTPQLDGVYVPLAIVERQKPKPQPGTQPEEKEKETEKLIPIAEERFFEDVLRQGKSDISQGRKIAIIGEPGAGKTTRLQKIADWILEQDLGLPIWIDLAELGEQDICEYLEKVWLRRCQGEVTRRDLEAQMSRVWLLLDGVDEMTHTQGMQQLAKDLLRSWVQPARVVVTCRVNVWEADKNAFSGFDVFRNLEFNREQVTEYIRRWFAGMGDGAAGESLEAELVKSENSRLKELIQNPLRLWMLCQIWSSRKGTLPDTQAKLYASFIKYIYRWKEQFIKTYAKLCGKTQSQCQELLHQGLGELAKAAIDGKSSRFRLSYQLVSEYLGERSDETSLLSLALSLGWLNRVGIDFDEPEESVYGFYHATFQEYFAALTVDDWDYFLPRNHVNFPVVGKEYRIFAAQWKQVILLWLGIEGLNRKQKDEFIEALGGFKDGCSDFYEYRVGFLAAAGIGEFKDCSRADEIVATIIKWGCGYLNIEKQKWQTFLDPIAEGARAALLQTNYSIAVNQLIDLLKTTDDEKVRLNIAEYLGKIDRGNPEAIATLVRIIETTENKLTCQIAAYSLEEIEQGNPQAIAALVRVLETTEDESTRWQVAHTLGQIEQGNSQAIAALVRVLETTEDESTRWHVAYTLGQIEQGNSQAIAALIKVLETTEDESTCIKAAKSLVEIDPENPHTIDALVRILATTKDENICQQSASNLEKIGQGNSQIIDYLVRIIETTERKFIRKKVAKSLGKIGQGNSQAVAALVKIIETSDDFEIFWAAAISLEEIGQGNPHAIAALVRIIETTEDTYTCMLAASSLGKIGQSNLDAIADLIRIIKTTEDEYTRCYAVESLGKIGLDNPQAITALVTVLETTDREYIRMLAAKSLSEIQLGNPDAIAALVRLLETNENESDRQEIAESLGKTNPGNPDAIAALIRIIKTTEHESVRQKAASSLWEIDLGNPKAIAAWVRLLETTKDKLIRIQAANSLEKIRQSNLNTIAAWIRLLETGQDGYGCGWAARNLGQIITTNAQRRNVISALKPHLINKTYENNFNLFEKCYQVLWNIAQELPYPDFYQAWHHQLTTPHPEVPETTGVGSTPFTQSLNLADLPKILEARLVETQLIDSVQLICIDTSKFIDPNNPAPDIYEQFLDQNCPERSNGEPETLSQLKSYWNRLRRHSDKHPILIFYEDPTSPAAQGFSPTFLEALTRFDGTICLIADTPHPPLQTFSPHEPDLLQAVVNWVKRVHFES
ncbi:HEAT repeat domain-containing protein [Microcoleus sp. A006_D1]|uniref:HEAT repeat domain-containing protein n=1 Tax=Microcoleus sp. A006_D1 TaxID=3055267 RepID=UPI002FD2851D